MEEEFARAAKILAAQQDQKLLPRGGLHHNKEWIGANKFSESGATWTSGITMTNAIPGSQTYTAAELG